MPSDPGGPGRRRLIATAEGTSDAPFTGRDWLLLLFPATAWGASFLLMAEGLESFHPSVVTGLRIIFGWLALATLPSARKAVIAREDRIRIALVGITWMAFPLSMFPIAEQWISSSVAGMLNGSLPLFSAVVAIILLRRLPGPSQRLGLVVGFAGVALISLPSMRAGSDLALGAALVIAATVSYGIATNLMVPLVQSYGSVATLWRALGVAAVLTAPFTIAGARHSTVEAVPALSVLALGAVGTGFAFIAAGTLMGRVGATRGSVVAYLIPVVALALGVVVRGESVEPIAVGGLALVLVGAWLTSRAGR